MSTEHETTPEKSEAEQAFDAFAEMLEAPAKAAEPPEPPAAQEPDAGQQPPAQQDARQEPDLAAQLAAERAEKERLQHQLASDRGRLLAFQREREEAQRAKAAEAAPADQGDANDEDELARLAEEYPEIAAPLQRTISKIEQRLGRVLTAQERVEAAEAERLEMQNAAAVERDDPGALAYVRSNADAFRAWVNSPDITVGMREKAERNARRIADPAEAKDVIAAFRRHMGVTTPSATQTTDRRQRQLEGARTPRGGAPARVATDVAPTNPEQAFAYYAKIAEREMGLSG